MKRILWLACMPFLVGFSSAEVIYSNDFSGAVGTPAQDSAPRHAIAGYVSASAMVEMDGDGHLQSVDSEMNGANYRFRLAPEPLNANPEIGAVKLTVVLRAPSREWVGLAFCRENANSVTGAAGAGPWLQINSSSITLHGGFYVKGNSSVFQSTHSAGDMLTVELTYSMAEKTVDITLNGNPVTNGMPITHIDFKSGTEVDAIIQWAQINLRGQQTAADGGSYIDGVVVETVAADRLVEKRLATIRVAGGEGAPGYVRMFFLGRNGLMGRSMYLFSDRHYKALKDFPVILHECLYYELPIQTPHTYECIEDGEVLALAPVNARVDRTAALGEIGFSRMPGIEPFQLFGDNPADVVGIFTKQVKAGETFQPPVWTVVAGFTSDRPPRYGELLYNGIRLPREWPPRYDKELWSSGKPLPVPYLDNPPKLIPIDIGRQLFVDDFLVEETDMVREYHYPQKYENNPILKPETDIELKGYNNLAVAGPKSGGLWWNPEKQLFEFWYEAGWVSSIAYATSRDGLVWERPDLPLKPGTNQVLPDEVRPDSWTVVRDYRATNPKENVKIFLRGSGSRERARAFLSEDGIDWGTHTDCGTCGDRSTMFYNPFRKVWVYSLRSQTTGFGGRSRDYWEGEDFMQGMHWDPNEPVRWARTDKLDPPDPRIGDTPQLYNLDAVAYESILLGCFEVLHGPHNDITGAKGLPKNTGLNFAYSRDGFHWHRPDRTIAINSEQRDVWDRGYVQPLGNICTVRGDKLWFYYIGFAGDPTMKFGEGGINNTMRCGMYGNGATGVAFLRRDGFVSFNSDENQGALTTRPATFSGKHLFVNADVPEGALTVEVLDMNGIPIEPFTFGNCIPFTGDSTLTQISWKGGDDLTALAGRAMRFRFRLKNGKLYSFWVSRDKTGRSDGYVAGGGPGFTCDMDTVGVKALEENKKFHP